MRSVSSETRDEHAAARRYLSTSDRLLDVRQFAEIGDQLLESRLPEYRFYGAWAHLEAAFPGLFSLQGNKYPYEGDIDSRASLDKALETFGALARRTPYFTGGNTARFDATDDVIFGIRSQMIYSLKPLFEKNEATGPRVLEQVTTGFARTAYMLREQDIALRQPRVGTGVEKQIELGHKQVRGLEVENYLLGLGWEAFRKGSEVILVPATPRNDYATSGDTPLAIDAVAIHQHSERRLGIPLRRDVFRSRTKGESLAQHPNILRLYGDRDLHLAPLNTDPSGFTAFPASETQQIRRIIEERFSKLEGEAQAA